LLSHEALKKCGATLGAAGCDRVVEQALARTSGQRVNCRKPRMPARILVNFRPVWNSCRDLLIQSVPLLACQPPL